MRQHPTIGYEVLRRQFEVSLVTPFQVDLSPDRGFEIERVLEDYPLRLREHMRQRGLVHT